MHKSAGLKCLFQATIFLKTCEVQKKVNINSVDANSKVESTIDGLFPYINYHVWIAAVNGQGDGEKNETLVMTDSEGKNLYKLRKSFIDMHYKHTYQLENLRS